MEIWLNESKRILNGSKEAANGSKRVMNGSKEVLNGSKRVMNESKDLPNGSNRTLNGSKNPSIESSRINLYTGRPTQKQHPFWYCLLCFRDCLNFIRNINIYSLFITLSNFIHA